MCHRVPLFFFSPFAPLPAYIFLAFQPQYIAAGRHCYYTSANFSPMTPGDLALTYAEAEMLSASCLPGYLCSLPQAGG
jgi:hypothetical protein